MSAISYSLLDWLAKRTKQMNLEQKIISVDFVKWWASWWFGTSQSKNRFPMFPKWILWKQFGKHVCYLFFCTDGMKLNITSPDTFSKVMIANADILRLMIHLGSLAISSAPELSSKAWQNTSMLDQKMSKLNLSYSSFAKSIKGITSQWWRTEKYILPCFYWGQSVIASWKPMELDTWLMTQPGLDFAIAGSNSPYSLSQLLAKSASAYTLNASFLFGWNSMPFLDVPFKYLVLY